MKISGSSEIISYKHLEYKIFICRDRQGQRQRKNNKDGEQKQNKTKQLFNCLETFPGLATFLSAIN